jgi:hypothetical protein
MSGTVLTESPSGKPLDTTRISCWGDGERGVYFFTGGATWARERECRCVQPERHLPAGTIGPGG